MKLLSFKKTENIALSALGLMAIVLTLPDNPFTFESFTRILILAGLFCGYFDLTKNRKISFALRLLIPLLIASVFLVYFIITRGAKPGWTIVLLLHGVALGAFGVGMLLRLPEINALYKLTFLQGFVILFIYATSRKFGEGWFAACTLLAFMLTSIYLGSKKPIKPLVISLILVATVLLIPLLESSWMGIAITLPVTLLGGVLNYFTIHQMMKTEYTVVSRFSPLLIFVLLSPLFWVLQENYTDSLYSINNSVSGETVQLSMVDKEGILIQENQAQPTAYLFWTASCGNCRKEFPYFSELALKYKDQENIKFYAVLIEYKASDSTAFDNET